MAKMILATVGLTDAATVSTGTSTAAGLGVENLTTDQPGEVCRFSATTAHIVVNFTRGVLPNIVALVSTSLTATATLQITMADSEGGLTASPPGYDSGSFNAWSGVGVTDPGAAYEWLRIDITDTDNADGYLDIGRLVIDEAYEPTRDADLGAEISLIDETQHSVAVGGQTLIWNQASLRRRASFGLGSMEAADRRQVRSIENAYGTFDPVLFVLDPAASDTADLREGAIYGTLRNLGSLRLPYPKSFQLYAKEFEIEEMLP